MHSHRSSGSRPKLDYLLIDFESIFASSSKERPAQFGVRGAIANRQQSCSEFESLKFSKCKQLNWLKFRKFSFIIFLNSDLDFFELPFCSL